MCVDVHEGRAKFIVWGVEGSLAVTLNLLHPGQWSRELAQACSHPPFSLPADLQWTCPDHRLALCGGLRWELVREGKVSVIRKEEWEGFGRARTTRVVTYGYIHGERSESTSFAEF